MGQPNIITMPATIFWVLCTAWGASISMAFAAGVAFWHKHAGRDDATNEPQTALRNTPEVKRAKRRIRDA